MAFQNVKGWTAEKDPNLWASLFLMILSGAVMSEALELEVESPGNPGSGFMIFRTSPRYWAFSPSTSSASLWVSQT